MTLTETAKEIRKTVLNMVYAAQSSHIGSNLSVIDILTAIFALSDKTRDELVVSKGWCAASVYALNAHHGLIPEKDLLTFNKEGSPYIGLIEPIGIFGCRVGSGSMGHGLPMAVGIALAKLKEAEGFTEFGSKVPPAMVYVVMSDGELDCGTTWESALIAKHHGLKNLVVFVDMNSWQAMGKTEDVLKVDAYEMFRAAGWNVFEVDGHDFGHLEHVMKTGALASPTVVLCSTIKGKGISEMEDKLEWHYRNIPEDVYKRAMDELCAA